MQNRLREHQVQLEAIAARMPFDAGAQYDTYTEPSMGSTVSSDVAEEDVEAAFLRAKRQRIAGRD
jgi:hypothetical protein